MSSAWNRYKTTVPLQEKLSESCKINVLFVSQIAFENRYEKLHCKNTQKSVHTVRSQPVFDFLK